MPPDEGKHLARHLLYPGNTGDVQALIEARKQALISVSDSGKLCPNNLRQDDTHGMMSPVERKLGEGQFIFLYLVISPDNPLDKLYNVAAIASFLDPLPTHEDHYGFAFELETLGSLDSYYRHKDLRPKFTALADGASKKKSSQPLFETLDPATQARLLPEAEKLRANDIPLATMLERGKLNYPKNLCDEEKPEILVRGKLQVSLASWFIVGGNYLTKDEFEQWKAENK